MAAAAIALATSCPVEVLVRGWPGGTERGGDEGARCGIHVH